MSEALVAIRDFVELSQRRLRGELPTEQRPQLEALEDQLRDLIDGSRPAPRRIENPSPAPLSSPGLQVVAANVTIRRSAPPPGPEDEVVPLELPVELPVELLDKVRQVEVASIAHSAYTPPAQPVFLGDYFEANIETNQLPPGVTAVRALVADGTAAGLSQEQEAMLGLERGGSQPKPATGAPTRPQRAAADGPALARIQLRSVAAPRASQSKPELNVVPVSARKETSTPAPQASGAPASAAIAASVAPPASITPASGFAPSTSDRAPVVVHLVGGASKRGELVTFDPAAEDLLISLGGNTEQIPFGEVFAVFIGVTKSRPPLPPTGTRIAVKLSNGKELVGCSPDYAPGAAAMTVVPDDRRTVDRVWLPAWSVAEIRLA